MVNTSKVLGMTKGLNTHKAFQNIICPVYILVGNSPHIPNWVTGQMDQSSSVFSSVFLSTLLFRKMGVERSFLGVPVLYF